MTITIIRPNQHVYTLPGYGQRIIEAEASVVVSSNWWEVSGKTCVAAYQPKGAASYAASKSNLVSPGTGDAGDGDAYPSWNTATGWTFTASSSQYLKTSVVPASGYSLLVRFANCTYPTFSGVYTYAGRRSGDNVDRFGVQSFVGGSLTTNFMSGAQMNVTHDPLPAAGVLGVAGQTGYHDGSAESGTIDAWGTNGTAKLFIGARGTDGAPQYFLNGDIIAIAVWSDTLTPGEVETVSTAMAAL